jgi:hypothetical protein
MEGGTGRRRNGFEGQGRNYAELSTARSAQRPEQLSVVVIIAVEHAAIGHHHLRADQVIGGQAVLPAEDSEAAPERRSHDRERPAGRDCPAVP